MDRKASKRFAGCVIAFAVVSAASPLALAWVLPAESILSAISKRRADIAFTTIIAEGTYQKEGAPEQKVWEAIRANRAHRIERKDATGQNTEVILSLPGKRWAFKLGEKPAAPQKFAGDLIFTFFGSVEKDAGTQRATAFLKAHDIDDNVVSMSRLDRRIAYIIGAKPWETNKPQMWVDKELDLPVRLIQVDRQTNSTIDTRLLGVGSATTGEWFPARIEVWRDGKLTETTTYSSARLNEEVSEDLFKPPT